jgi:F420-0:gamma-glutamyl ligase
MKKIEVLGLQTIPEIKQGDNLAEIIVNCAGDEIGSLEDRDVFSLSINNCRTYPLPDFLEV